MTSLDKKIAYGVAAGSGLLGYLTKDSSGFLASNLFLLSASSLLYTQYERVEKLAEHLARGFVYIHDSVHPEKKPVKVYLTDYSQILKKLDRVINDYTKQSKKFNSNRNSENFFLNFEIK